MQMALAPIFKKAYWSLAALGGIYVSVLIALTNPNLFRHSLYAHKIQSTRWKPIERPESFGFAKKQVTAFNITTPDGEDLYAWHVLPLGVYAKHEERILQEPSGPVNDFTKTLPFKLLKDDPESRVIINFHGNAGHLGQGYRPQIYRSLTSASTNAPLHVLTVDYRGFGRSTGSPTEAGLITDAITLVTYILTTLQIPPERILLVGQSLGTAVATATALHFADPSTSLLPKDQMLLPARTSPKGIDFAGLLLVCPFTTLATLLPEYRVSGLVPMMSPLRSYPRLMNFLLSYLPDTWETAPRLAALASATGAKGRHLNAQIIHARDDWDIPPRLSEELFRVATKAIQAEGKGSVLHEVGVGDKEKVEVVGSGRRPRVRKEEFKSGRKDDGRKVGLEILEFGGHNPVVANAPVALAALKLLGIA